MAVYTLSDLHLAKSIDKPMDIFGSGWMGYMDRIEQNWRSTVKEEDTVVIGGDLSWAMYLEECESDFDFLESLPGSKVILKGNHDYWWESITKLNKFVFKKGYKTMHFLHNNSYVAENMGIFGTRGWLLPDSDSFKEADRKIYLRELIRLELSYNHLKSIANCGTEFIAVLHYPPVTKQGVPDEGIHSFLKSNNIKRCVFGHLHGIGAQNSFSGECDGVEYILASADYLNFMPLKLN